MKLLFLFVVIFCLLRPVRLEEKFYFNIKINCGQEVIEESVEMIAGIENVQKYLEEKINKALKAHNCLPEDLDICPKRPKEATSSTSSIAKPTSTANDRTTATPLHTTEASTTAPSTIVSSTSGTESTVESTTFTTPCIPDRNLKCEQQNDTDTCQILCSDDCGSTCFWLWYKRNDTTQKNKRLNYNEAKGVCSETSSVLTNFTSVAQFKATARVVWNIINTKGWPFDKHGKGTVSKWGALIWTGMMKNKNNEIISNGVEINLDWDKDEQDSENGVYILFRLKQNDVCGKNFPIRIHDLKIDEDTDKPQPGVLCQGQKNP